MGHLNFLRRGVVYVFSPCKVILVHFALLSNVDLVFISTFDKVIDLLDQTVEVLLLVAELLLHSIEVVHESVKFAVFATFVMLVTRVQNFEFLLEFFLRIRLVLLHAIDGEEVRKFGSIFALPNLYNDPHDSVLEHILAHKSLISCTILRLVQLDDKVARKLLLLLQNFVLFI